ncbi:MAG: type I 3-dehydroquinate dehydratase [Nitrososphaerota archaeon]|nr:type I 3-dehydroquinate dehydratase [Aigarchaeota archaeon]MDW8076615.1 type I 3-dehydroquinate dehydratase [Nitrososphaerota archaeon]
MKTERFKLCVSTFGRDVNSLKDSVVKAIESDADIVEVRLDYLKELDVKSVSSALRPYMGKLLLTLRPRYENGLFEGDEEERAEILKKLCQESPAYVDIELRSPMFQELTRELMKIGTTVIVSWHDFEKTPEIDELRRIVDLSMKGGSIVKIVTMAKSFSDNLKVLSLYNVAYKHRLIAFCMGTEGILSRFLSLMLGAPFMYVSLPGAPTAPGQPSIIEAKEVIRMLSSNHCGA